MPTVHVQRTAFGVHAADTKTDSDGEVFYRITHNFPTVEELRQHLIGGAKWSRWQKKLPLITENDLLDAFATGEFTQFETIMRLQAMGRSPKDASAIVSKIAKDIDKIQYDFKEDSK